MKKTAFAAALLAVLMIATMCLTACGSKNNEPDPAVTENSTLTAKVGTTLVVNGTSVNVMGTEFTLQDGKLVAADQTATYAVNGTVITVLDADGAKMIFEKQ